MATRQPFWEPFAGTLNEDMPKGSYVTVATGSHGETENGDAWMLWDRLGAEAQKLSVRQDYQQGLVTQGMISPALEAIDRCIVDLRQRRVTHADKIFQWSFGGPARYAFEPYPVMFPASSRWGFKILQDFLGAAYQVPRWRSNRLDTGIIHRDAMTSVKALLTCKVAICVNLFQIEAAGRISPDELDAMFAGLNVQPPVVRKEGADALAVETTERPAEADVTSSLEGSDILTWVPTVADWAVFGEIQEREADAGPEQRPPEPIALTEGPMVGASSAATRTTRARR